MTDYVKVSTQQIQRDRNLIQSEIDGLTASIGELLQGMQALGSTWEGPAWQSFQNQLAVDMERMREISSQLGEFLQHMEYAEKEYRQCDHKIGQLVSSIRI